MGILSIDRTIEKMKHTKLVTWSNNIQKMHEGAEKRRREQNNEWRKATRRRKINVKCEIFIE